MNSGHGATVMMKDLYYLPPLAWFFDFNGKDVLQIDSNSYYRKSTLMNRCYIAGANGKLMLSIPLVGGRGVKRQIRDVEICYEERWQQVHWNSICSAYNKSTFFSYYKDHFRGFYENKTQFLVELNLQLLQTCLRILNIDIVIELVEDKQANPKSNSLARPIQSEDVEYLLPYHQVFQHRHDFITGLSIIDLIFNLGPEAKNYLLRPW